MKKVLYVFIFLVSYNINALPLEDAARKQESTQINRITSNDVTLQLPRFIFTYTNTRVIVKFNDPANSKLKDSNYQLNFIVNGMDQKVVFDNNGIGSFYYTFTTNHALNILMEDLNYTVQPPLISIWYMLAPLISLLLFFVYKIIIAIKRANHHSKLIVKRNMGVINTNPQLFESTLHVVRVTDRPDREEKFQMKKL
jgi:hypothetical protein